MSKGIATPPRVVGPRTSDGSHTQSYPVPERDSASDGRLADQCPRVARRAAHPVTRASSALRDQRSGHHRAAAERQQGLRRRHAHRPRWAWPPFAGDPVSSWAANSAALTHGHPSGYLTAGFARRLVAGHPTARSLTAALEIGRPAPALATPAREAQEALRRARCPPTAATTKTGTRGNARRRLGRRGGTGNLASTARSSRPRLRARRQARREPLRRQRQHRRDHRQHPRRANRRRRHPGALDRAPGAARRDRTAHRRLAVRYGPEPTADVESEAWWRRYPGG